MADIESWCNRYWNDKQYKQHVDREAHIYEDQFLTYVNVIYNKKVPVNEDIETELLYILAGLNEWSIPRRLCQKFHHVEVNPGHKKWIRNLRFSLKIPYLTQRENINRQIIRENPQFYDLSEDTRRILQSTVEEIMKLT